MLVLKCQIIANVVSILCIKINNNEIAHTPQLINHVKKFLLDKGYKIIEIEENNINTGWKILWSD